MYYPMSSCAHCTGYYRPTKRTQKYCSASCRSSAHQKRKKMKASETSVALTGVETTDPPAVVEANKAEEAKTSGLSFNQQVLANLTGNALAEGGKQLIGMPEKRILKRIEAKIDKIPTAIPTDIRPGYVRLQDGRTVAVAAYVSAGQTYVVLPDSKTYKIRPEQILSVSEARRQGLIN